MALAPTERAMERDDQGRPGSSYALSRAVPVEIMRPPLTYRVARFLVRRVAAGRGAWRVFGILGRFGVLDGTAKFDFYDGLVEAPLDWIKPFIHASLTGYQERRIRAFCALLNDCAGPFTLVDCGADIGLMTLHVQRNCPRLIKAIAIEPNGAAFVILARNMARLGSAGEPLHGAVGAQLGRGRLVTTQGAPKVQDHSAYIISDPEGDVRVVTIDSLELPTETALALKVDVEGAEIDTLAGARQALTRAPRAFLFIEIHPTVLQRIGEPDTAILRAASEIRPFHWYFAEVPDVEIDPNKSVFDQLGVVRQTDLIGVSR